jgi:hypothetical protein
VETDAFVRPAALNTPLLLFAVSELKRELKTLSHHFLTFLPECLDVVHIERIPKYSFVYGIDGRVVPAQDDPRGSPRIPAPDLVITGSRPIRRR